MSLPNWLESGYLRRADPTGRDIRAKLEVADRDLNDAEVVELSIDTRFRLAYEGMLVVAQALLLAEGLRPGPRGGHYYSVESLEHTLGEDRDSLILLHTMSKKRHLLQYDFTGGVSPEELSVMLREARRILEAGRAGLAARLREDFGDGS